MRQYVDFIQQYCNRPISVQALGGDATLANAGGSKLPRMPTRTGRAGQPSRGDRLGHGAGNGRPISGSAERDHGGDEEDVGGEEYEVMEKQTRHR